MERFEKLVIPIAAVVALGAWWLSTTSTDTAILVARVFGVLLVVVLITGFAARVIVRRKRARRTPDEALRESQDHAGGNDAPAPGAADVPDR